MKVKVDVTAEDIEAGKGHAGRACKCPVALAMARATKNKVYVSQTRWATILFDDKSWQEFETPTEAAEFISKFDANLPVEPFTFELEIP